MAEAILAYALTTVARVKTRLTITVNNHDTPLLYLINSVTDFIEGECNRRFKETTYTNEVYSPQGGRFIVLKQSPVSSISSVQYRVGLKSNPTWTDFNADDWELMEDGQSGMIEAHGILHGTNLFRVTYVAGYKINFTNYGDNNTHTLPADITDLCERLVVRWFKRRESGGKQSEGLQGGSINWKDELDSEDKATLARYKRIPNFV
jgi:hypothetical protein